jgi:hypothetical protein
MNRKPSEARFTVGYTATFLGNVAEDEPKVAESATASAVEETSSSGSSLSIGSLRGEKRNEQSSS